MIMCAHKNQEVKKFVCEVAPPPPPPSDFVRAGGALRHFATPNQTPGAVPVIRVLWCMELYYIITTFMLV